MAGFESHRIDVARDELMDDVDYYPEPYLDRLAHEGINGLWITVEWRNLAGTAADLPKPR